LWNNKGNALSHLQRWQEALAAYDRPCALDPHLASPWNGTGWVLLALDHPLVPNRRRAALAHFDRALTLDPTSAAAWNEKGNMLRDEKRFAEALHAYKRAIALGLPPGLSGQREPLSGEGRRRRSQASNAMKRRLWRMITSCL
jgi:tetratricopeptide (TPR) repeat protein